MNGSSEQWHEDAGDAYNRERSDAGKPRLRIVLTFDDGPETTKGLTEQVHGVLQKRRIVAGFFVQALVTTPPRGGHDGGLQMIKALAETHVIGIHTGSVKDHVPHTCRVLENADDGLGENALESDIIKARKRLESLGEIRYIRPPFGEGNAQTRAVYDKLDIRSVLWNIDPEDWKSGQTSDGVKQKIATDLSARSRGQPVVALFHDVQEVTAVGIDEFIDILDDEVRQLGYTPTHMRSKSEVEGAFDDFRSSNPGRRNFLGSGTTRTLKCCQEECYKRSGRRSSSL